MSSRLCRTSLPRSGTARLLSLSVVATAALMGAPAGALAQSTGEDAAGPATSEQPTQEPAPQETPEPEPTVTPEPTAGPGAEPAAEATSEPTPDPEPTEVGPSGSTGSEPAVAPTADPTEGVDDAPATPSPAPTATSEPVAKADAGRALAADFGLGKAFVDVAVEPLAGTSFPDGADLSGAVVEIRVGDGIILTPEDFQTVRRSPARAAAVRASARARDLAAEPGPPDATCTTDADGTCGSFVVIGGTDVTVTQVTAPKGFLLPTPAVVPLQDGAPECEAAPSPELPDLCTVVFQDPGVYRTLGLDVTSSVDGTPLEGAVFTLCSPTSGPPPASDAKACPAGSSALDQATTDGDGQLDFADLLLPSADYSIFQTATMDGYVVRDGLRRVAVPAATSVAQAKAPVVVDVTNDPDVAAPVAADDTARTLRGKAVTIDFLGNDDLDGAELLDLQGTGPGNGSVDIVEDGAGNAVALRYTPDAGFTGVDGFTYTITTRGGSDTATVGLTVVAPAVGGGGVVSGRPLPVTGTEAGQVLLAAAALLGTGGLLLAAGSTRVVRVRTRA